MEKKEKLTLGIGTSQKELDELKNGLSIKHATELADSFKHTVEASNPMLKYLKPDGYAVAELERILEDAVEKDTEANGDHTYSILGVAKAAYPALAEYFAALSPAVPKADHNEALNEALTRQVEAERNLEQALEANEKLHNALLKKEEQVDKALDVINRLCLIYAPANS